MLYKSYHTAGNVDEALMMLRKFNNSQIIAGGTDLMVRLQENHQTLKSLVDVSCIADLKKIELEQSTIRIGAAVTYSEIINSEIVQQHAPILVAASRATGATQIQHMGTVGGNIANASPAGDILCALYACEAQLVLASLEGERLISLNQFIQSAGKTELQPGEMITHIQLQVLAEDSGSAFIKYGLRQSQAISVLNVSVVLQSCQGKIGHTIVAVGAVAPTVVICQNAARVLNGSMPSPALFERAGEIAQAETCPIDDLRGSASMRRYLVKPLIRQALQAAWNRCNGNQED
jgi:xanthine dehydrogenase FAD-binding subunit